jgi:lipopolysaccharide export system protein LptC
METKWIIITLAAIVAALVVAYLLWQNFRDKEELSNQLNRDYKSEKSENAAIEENEI